MVQTDWKSTNDATGYTSASATTIPTCKCCGGSGVQTRNDGIRIVCPACGGTGEYASPMIVYMKSWQTTPPYITAYGTA